MNKQQEIKQKREQTAILFGNKCQMCLKKFGKDFHFHHIGYRDDERKHSDFSSHYEYSLYVLPIIQKIPDEFALMCKKCHHLITILQAIKNNQRFERVVDMARRSRK